MKNTKKSTAYLSIAALIAMILMLNPLNNKALRATILASEYNIYADSDKKNNEQYKKEESEDEDETIPGPELEKMYFERWHEPFGNILEPEMMSDIQGQIKRLPQENNSQMTTINSWSCIGPYGMNVTSHSGTKYSGRILDIEPPLNGASVRVASASGGLWQFTSGIFPSPEGIMNGTTSLSTGAFATKPGDKNTILVGTGEESQRTGTGLWKTVNEGASWTNIPFSPPPSAFYRIKYTPGNVNRIHAVTDAGYFRSDDGGNTWTRKFTGNITDIAISSGNSNDLYITKWGDSLTGGVYSTVNGGDSWFKLTGSVLPTTNVGRSAITECASSPWILYALITRYDNNQPLGVFKTTNYGSNWTNVSPSLTALGGNGWYNAVIAVKPTDPNRVLAGMTNLVLTGNGGSSWSQVTDPDVHADQHALVWTADGATLYNGNDGGLSTSTDAGLTWSTSNNRFGITQYYWCDVGKTNNRLISGGAQDNGLSVTTDAGNSGWNNTYSGDGAGIAVDPTNSSRIFSVDGAFGGSILFRRFVSGNNGQSWTDFNTGITDDQNWAPVIRTDNLSPFKLYTNANNYIYYSQTPYNTWVKLNTIGFPAPVSNVTVTNGGVVYACLAANTASIKLRVYDNGSWYERSSGLPQYSSIRTVVHRTVRLPFLITYSYALVNGLGSPGQKIYRTTDNGQSWGNITGDLPNVPLGDLVPHPTNASILYVGSEFGCYKTTNGGANWVRWNNGMPDANIVTEMGGIDSLSATGKYYIVAATFGRGVWIRDISGDDPLTLNQSNGSSVPDKYALHQNYPNPFNPSTAIKFDVPKESHVRLSVFDISGRLVEILADKNMAPSKYEIVWNAGNYSSGIYFCKIETGDFTDTKKMILVK